ncbi:competence protein CoiA family protein [Actinomadura gamaensis]|uniref:Competence protein CoiA family protein n=1 Tax=Actinomadura gamaensis TaxID=1763541 RepID=A0ABV9TYX5_9ACTN
MDQRLIKTAVLGGPDSLEPVIMPTDYATAMGLRLTHKGATFWCGTRLGGCGRRITTRIGKKRVPHFAHFPDAEDWCRRTRLGEDSADHPFIDRDLQAWLARQGAPARTPEFLQESAAAAGGCAGLLLESSDGRKKVAVVLDDDDPKMPAGQ